MAKENIFRKNDICLSIYTSSCLQFVNFLQMYYLTRLNSKNQHFRKFTKLHRNFIHLIYYFFKYWFERKVLKYSKLIKLNK